MNNTTMTGGDHSAATISGDARAAGYQTKDEQPANVADAATGDDRDRDGGYLHRDIRPQGHRADSRGNPQPRAVVAPLRNR
jgi:hypothetical protein